MEGNSSQKQRQTSTTYNQLLDEDSLAYSGASEEANLAASGVRGQQVDDFDSSNQKLGRGRLLRELRGISVDRHHFDAFNGASLINGIARHIHNATQSGRANRDLDGTAGVNDLRASD